ncbi:glycosyltransferase [Mesonia maritima]|uniref:Glycosyltransferase involved in cell wall biosynthesis n=1 Tax=Mesonia maritima TaxID=1793873 RepID=A0ABU1K6G4_9FLAO|nr:glycosyltransferase [Mesonia maritima]MDR6301205.1 glycosyltransferase involved in cell wall biosynthesis [Mesonia maritima]
MANFSPKKKICIVSISLAEGGAERSTALLTQMLDKLGYEVHLAILTDKISYNFKGKLLNLGEKKRKSNTIVSRFLRFNVLRKYLLQQKFDYIIDNRVKNNPLKELYYLNYIYKNQRLIYVVRSYFIENYFAENKSWLSKYASNQIVEKVSKIVAVSKSIEKRISEKFNTEKAFTIYNPIESLEKGNLNIEGNYILFLGRLVDEVKNISLLLEAYAESELPALNIKLKLLGSGPDLSFLQSKVKALELIQNVEFVSYTPQVYPYLKQAKFTVLTSKYEGFPRVLIESLSVGTPVISVDCESGPGEIIQHKKNGLLVENHNSAKLASAMNQMIKDEKLYLTCKENAKASVKHLSLDLIAQQWDEILST